MNTAKLLAASFVALFAISGLTGCAETVTASSRISGGTGALPSLGGGRAANTPAPQEARIVERPVRDRDARGVRESRFTRVDFDCRMCR
ncbi:MAG: hypothetical protein JST00_05600 [Deltaproteobacteria bacterium]|nr:hypothetical protein [Deltaproteobacteria bacterium]